MKRISNMVLGALLLAGFTACGPQAAQKSTLDVTDVPHTVVKRQSIGNCWLYATATWAEALHLKSTTQEVDMSESYWTYWHWFDQIKSAGTSIETGGSWEEASRIIAKRGWMTEEEFIPSEKGVEMSLAQSRAESIINTALAKGGKLHTQKSRSKKNMMAVLDEAFGVNMKDLQAKAHKASEFIVGKNADGTDVTLDKIINNSGDASEWQSVYYPQARGDRPLSEETEARRKAILKRVMKALNDRQPVIMSVMVEFNGLKTDPYATFDYDYLQAAGSMGGQGGHLVVLEDYTVNNVPGIGFLGEGDMSDELKAAALDGDIVTIKSKNSWGANRPSRGLADGHTAFTIDYLNRAISWMYSDESKGQVASPTNSYKASALSEFVLPVGY